jgi:hypothetical protein
MVPAGANQTLLLAVSELAIVTVMLPLTDSSATKTVFWLVGTVVSTVSVALGATVEIVSSGTADNNVWFAPAGTTSFSENATTMTKAASGTATTITAPTTEGSYKLYVIDAAGNSSD